MRAIDIRYIFGLFVIIVLVASFQFIDSNRKYSTVDFWQTATAESVHPIPVEALKPGNKFGSPLIWAAMTTSNPEIIKILVKKGADINQYDDVLDGTALSRAAANSANPSIIRELVHLGSNVNDRLKQKHTALMMAAMYNSHHGIIEELITQGADLTAKNSAGATALDLAKEYKNDVAMVALKWKSTDLDVTNNGK